MNLIIRPIRSNETILLSEFLYEAIYQSDALHPVPRTILQHPSLWKYIEEFGTREGDLCVVGNMWKDLEHGKGIYALWQRLIRLSLVLRGPGLFILMDL